MWVDRHIEPLLLQRAATRPVVVLTGARQTGKTSLMRRLFPNHKWTEHPDARDASALRRIAGELPPGSVRSLSIFCRAPNAYPLDGDAHAVPLEAPDALADWA